MSRATDYLEQLGADNRVIEPTAVEAIIGLGMVLDGRLGQLNATLEHIADLLGSSSPPPRLADYAHIEEDEEPDVDDEPPPDYGPPGSGAVIVEWP